MQITKDERKMIVEIGSRFMEEISLIQCKLYSIDNHQKKIHKSYKYSASKQMSMNNLYHFNELVKVIDQAEFPNKVKNDIIDSLQPTYKVGDIFRGLPKLHYNEESTNFDLQKDATSILLFWDSMNTASFQLLQDLLKADFDESLNLKILAINIDSDIQTWENSMKKTPNLQSYYLDLQKESNRMLKSLLNIQKTPYVIITDEESEIMFVKNAVKLSMIKESLEQIPDIQHSQTLETKEIQSNQKIQIVDKLNNSLQYIHEIMEMVDNLFEITDTIEFKYIEIKQLHKDGRKEIISKKRLLVGIETTSSKLELIEALKEYLSSVIDHEFIIIKQIIHKDDDQKLTIRSVITDIVQQRGIQISPFDWQQYQFTWNFQENCFICESNSEIRLKTQSELNPEQYSEIKQLLDPVLESIDEENIKYANNLLESIQRLKDSGDAFSTITDYQDKNNNIVSISHKQGQVLIIIWLIPCAFTIFKLEKFYTKMKEQYGDKIRLVYLGLNNYQQDIDVVYKVNPTAEFYHPKNENHPSQQQYKVNLFPYQLIIDQKGQIQDHGVVHKLEQKIQKLFEQPQSKQEDAEINLEQLINFLITQQIINKNYGHDNEFKFKIILETNQNQQLKAFVEYFVREIHYIELLPFINALKIIIPASKLTIKELVMRATSIPYPGKICEKCKCRLFSDVQQYYNPFKEVFYCTTCGEAPNREKYEISDNLVFINTPITNIDELKDIDTYRFGVNAKNEDTSFTQQLQYICNGCLEQKSTKQRYIVLNNQKGYYKEGGYTDFCQDCFIIIKEKQEKWKSFKEINENSVYLRLTYQRAYSDF